MGALSVPFTVCGLLSLFGGVMALVVAGLKSFTEGVWAPARLINALHFLFGMDLGTVRRIGSPGVEQVLVYILEQPLWIVLFGLGFLLTVLAKVISAPGR